MRHLLLFILLSLATASPALAVRLRITGTVTEHAGRAPLSEVFVRVYRNGQVQQAMHTGSGGRYAFLLENHAQYVIRFSAPGMVTKCFAIDTRGAEWEGDSKVKDLEVEMTMIERVPGLDLSFFDMPMGMARFEPMTGLLAWNKEYEEFVRPRVADLMSAYERRMGELASAASGVAPSVH